VRRHGRGRPRSPRLSPHRCASTFASFAYWNSITYLSSRATISCARAHRSVSTRAPPGDSMTEAPYSSSSWRPFGRRVRRHDAGPASGRAASRRARARCPCCRSSARAAPAPAEGRRRRPSPARRRFLDRPGRVLALELRVDPAALRLQVRQLDEGGCCRRARGGYPPPPAMAGRRITVVSARDRSLQPRCATAHPRRRHTRLTNECNSPSP